MKNQFAHTLIWFAVSIAILYIGEDLLLPLFTALFLGMLLYPMCRFLERKRFPRPLAIVLSLSSLIIFLGGIFTLLGSQLMEFSSEIPELQKSLTVKISQLQQWLQTQFGVSNAEQLEWITTQGKTILESSSDTILSIFGSFTSGLAFISVVLIYTFMVLMYRRRLVHFLVLLFPAQSHANVHSMVQSVQGITKSYLSGLGIVIVILAIMNSIGLLILGVEPAIFLGILAALLNVIPYIGVLIGSIIPVLIALLTADSILTPILVFAVFSFNQFIENNFLTPKIVGSKISVNPFATIVFILLGGMIWGVGGMILFIPLLGVIKVVFDHFEVLHPYAYLIGESDEDSHPH